MMEHHRGRGQTHWGWVGRELISIERPSIAVRSGRSFLASVLETAERNASVGGWVPQGMKAHAASCGGNLGCDKPR